MPTGNFLLHLKRCLPKIRFLWLWAPTNTVQTAIAATASLFLRTNYTRFHDMSWSKATPKYYSFDTANVRFVFLDTNVAEGAVWCAGNRREIGADRLAEKYPGFGRRKMENCGNERASIFYWGARQPKRGFCRLGKIFEDYRVTDSYPGGGC